MEQSLKNFSEQFKWKPILVGQRIETFSKILVIGMGGSALPGMILKSFAPEKEIIVHKDYGLPENILGAPKDSLIVVISYSGNTEEAIDALEESYSRGLKVVAISTGGHLLDYAKQNNIPYIEIPQTGIQPRTAIGYLLSALVEIVLPEFIDELQKTGQKINLSELDQLASETAGFLKNLVPIIYSSVRNESVAYVWKIFMNENAKIPSFMNLFPEVNHNEMAGFDFSQSNQTLSQNMGFVFIRDSEDDERIQKRMEIFQNLLEEKGLVVKSLYLSGENRIEKILKGIMLGAWTSLKLAKIYEVDPEKVDIIENFKKLLNQ